MARRSLSGLLSKGRDQQALTTARWRDLPTILWRLARPALTGKGVNG